MEVYERVIKVVKPKQAKLAEAEAELAVQMEKLTAKQAELKEVEDALKVLNDQVSFMLFRSNSCFFTLVHHLPGRHTDKVFLHQANFVFS